MNENKVNKEYEYSILIGYDSEGNCYEYSIKDLLDFSLEIYSKEEQVQYLDDIIQDVEHYRKSEILTDIEDLNYSLPIKLGYKEDGNIYCGDLRKMGHILIGGASGQGKGIVMKNIAISLLADKKPSDLGLIFIDPSKSVFDQFTPLCTIYNVDGDAIEPGIQSDTAVVLKTLDSLEAIQFQRLELLKTVNSINLHEYETKTGISMQNIVVLIYSYDHFAIDSDSFLKKIAHILEIGHRVGIHVVMATMRITYKFLPLMINANIPSRISLRVASKAESRTLIHSPKAVDIKQCGDMYISVPFEELQLIHGFNTSGEKIEEIVAKYYGKK